MARLEVSDIHTSYGLSRALSGVSLDVDEGEVVALLGRNGVGKTTTMRSIIGLTPPQRGSVTWDNRSITGEPVHRIARLGIGFVPEDRRIFPQMSVSDNLQIARRSSPESQWNEAAVYELFPDLGSIADRPGGVLSGGQQQMLAIGRCLMGNPRLLLLDEPSEGLAPLVVASLLKQLVSLKQTGLSILLAEQNLRFALELSDRVHVMERGEIRYSTVPAEVAADDSILKSFLTV
jgi:branched-chain amino acid transport system ATP-binding protein